jgi:hypothetical protein
VASLAGYVALKYLSRDRASSEKTEKYSCLKFFQGILIQHVTYRDVSCASEPWEEYT